MPSSSPRLAAEFYQSTDVVALSQALLGKLLVTGFEGHLTAGMIMETEAYRASDTYNGHAIPYKLFAAFLKFLGIDPKSF